MKKYEKEVLQSRLDAEANELRHLKAIYNKASEDIIKKIEISNGKINVLLSNWDNLTEEEKSIYQSQIYQRDFQKSLKSQIDGFLKDLNSKQYANMTEYMEDCYKNGYLGAMYSIHKQGIPIISPIDQKKVTKAMFTDSAISKKLYIKLGEDVELLKKRIANNLSRGIATASEYKVIARNIAADSNVGFNRAMRIARTEGGRISNESAYDASIAAKEKGADVLKSWDAALDGRTRESHRRVDGEIRELDEPFSNGMMYPSDPAGGAAEVVNCRCALLQRARWALDEDELQTLKDRAAYYGLDKTKNFDDFKAKYLKAADKAERIKYDEDRQAQIKARREAYFARKAAKQGSIPDFTNMEYADVMKWADSNLKTTFEDLKGTNKDFVKETVKALATFESKMDGTIEGLSVKFGGLSGNLFAKYDDKTKTLLLKKTGSLKAFEDKLKDENARYRAKWKRDKDYNATDTFSGTVLHELGHAVDIDTGQSLSRELGANKELYSKSLDVSAYAGTQMNVRATKASEAWAENFAAYMAGGANAKKVPDEVKEMIEDYFNTKRAKKVVENSAKSSKMVIHKSLGAAAKNYQVKLADGNGHTKLVENQKIEGKVFAGKGTDSEIRDRFRLESDYHIPADEWEKVSGKGYVILDGKRVLAELHWYEADGEIYEMKVKRYLDES